MEIEPKALKNLSQREIIRPSEIQGLYGISRSTAYRLMKVGKLPKLISLSPGCKGWHKRELDTHFEILPAT